MYIFYCLSTVVKKPLVSTFEFLDFIDFLFLPMLASELSNSSGSCFIFCFFEADDAN